MERQTVDLVSERSVTMRLTKPGVADKPRFNSGAYSVTTKKPRAGTEGGARSAAPAGCEVLEVCDGQVMLRINGTVVKLAEADARTLAEMIMQSLP